MPSQRDIFEVSGPTYLTSVDWSCPHDQRVVVASLVKATYIKAKYRVKPHAGPELLSPAWCQHFHFHLIKVLIDDFHDSVIGCIFEFKPPFSRHPSAPRFVVALRGTMLDLTHGIRDLWLDLRVIFGGINKSTRCQTVLDAVQELLPAEIWLSGHSLGASIATVVGKYYAKTDNIYIKTFLFNPPFPSISLDSLLTVNDKLKKGLRIFKGGVSIFMQDQHKKSHEEFLKLAPWTPYLFVNPQDPISTSYIRYFEGRKNADGTILGSIEQVARETSLRGICGDILGEGSEMPHLLPSARLAVNLKKCDLLECHGIRQWWQQHVSLKFDDYHYQPNKC